MNEPRIKLQTRCNARVLETYDIDGFSVKIKLDGLTHEGIHDIAIKIFVTGVKGDSESRMCIHDSFNDKVVLLDEVEQELPQYLTGFHEIDFFCEIEGENGEHMWYDILDSLPMEVKESQNSFQLRIECVVNGDRDKDNFYITTIDSPFLEPIQKKTADFHSLNFKIAVINELESLGFYADELGEIVSKESDKKVRKALLKFCKKVEIEKAMLKEITQLYIHPRAVVYDLLSTEKDVLEDYTIKSLADISLLKNLDEVSVAGMLDVDDYSPVCTHENLRRFYDYSLTDEVKKELAQAHKRTTKSVEWNAFAYTFFKEYKNAAVDYYKTDEKQFIFLAERAILYHADHKLLMNIAEKYRDNPPKYTAILKRVIKAEPEYSLGWNNLAFQYYKQGNYDEALESIDKAIECKDCGNMPLATKAEILFAMGGKEDEFFKFLGRSFETGVDPGILESAIEKEYGDDPRYIEAVGNYGFVLIKTNKKDVFPPTALKTDRVYTYDVKEGPTAHPFNPFAKYYFIDELVEKMDQLFVPILKLDLQHLGLGIPAKIPVFYQSNEKVEWLVYKLNTEDKVEHIQAVTENRRTILSSDSKFENPDYFIAADYMDTVKVEIARLSLGSGLEIKEWKLPEGDFADCDTFMDSVGMEIEQKGLLFDEMINSPRGSYGPYPTLFYSKYAAAYTKDNEQFVFIGCMDTCWFDLEMMEIAVYYCQSEHKVAVRYYKY